MTIDTDRASIRVAEDVGSAHHERAAMRIFFSTGPTVSTPAFEPFVSLAHDALQVTLRRSASWIQAAEMEH
jgi:hypothetical protein